MAGSGANRRGPGHHERSGPDQHRDDVLRAGPDLFRPQSRLPDRGRLHGSPRRADPACLLHLDLRVLGLDHRQPGHGESVLPQHLDPRRARHHPQLGGKPADHTSIENPPQATRAACSVTPRPGWNTSCAATRLRPPPPPGRIRSWSRTLTGQATPPSEPGASGKGARAGKYREPCERRSRQKPTQNTRIWEAADRASRRHDPEHSGGSRAMPAASDWHVARLVFQSVSVLIADSALKDGQMQLSPTARWTRLIWRAPDVAG
jgi:hypothetical protein